MKASLFLPLIIFGLAACGSDDQPPPVIHTQPKPKAENRPELSALIAKNDLELTRHGLAQLAVVRKALENAVGLGFQADFKQRVYLPPNQTWDFGCAKLLKESPATEGQKPAFSERFVVSYRCREESTETKAAMGELSGRERYLVSYDKPYPGQNGADFDVATVVPVAISIDVLDMNIRLSLIQGSSHEALVSKSGGVSIEFVSSDEKTATYRINSEQKSQFDYVLGEIRRNGTLTASVSDAVFKVDRKTRRASYVSASGVSVRLVGSESAVQYPEMSTPFDANVDITPVGGVVTPETPCATPEGIFRVKRRGSAGDARMKVTSTGGQILKEAVAEAAAEGGIKAAVVCSGDGDSADPLFLQEYSGLYL